MLPLDLSTEELTTLADVLESYLSDLRMEIANTDSYDFREELKERKALIVKVLEMIAVVRHT